MPTQIDPRESSRIAVILFEADLLSPILISSIFSDTGEYLFKFPPFVPIQILPLRSSNNAQILLSEILLVLLGLFLNTLNSEPSNLFNPLSVPIQIKPNLSCIRQLTSLLDSPSSVVIDLNITF